ncbi:MAG: hypothetical protein A3J66_01305 [Candidatus Magasanikbacteria bacterium RIFCSPHIGHO2_02_FULL_47_14]|uniref:Uncharacterized protein n=1 Tax=Candidatus Magasanikbacteria bacterium RIFCSPHIGHO2_02_FULL_47_14 TaxID=1798680 RepID=A0A1F6M216_9BACT|nr:MAG: hypothetical protein A3J66_01305 [Candidatus Magasanikbacteria bacterium RIFCSPHIGHO2_02_FULL_47_14]
MNLYEFEGKKIFETYGIQVPRGVVVRRGENYGDAYQQLDVKEVVVKAQTLSGKRGKSGGITFASSKEETEVCCEKLFNTDIRGQYIAAIRIEEKLVIAEEHYLSITYDTNKRRPVLIYSAQGGMDIEDVPEEKIVKQWIDIRSESVGSDIPFANELWQVFLKEDTRLVEINPLVKTVDGVWIAADAKIAIDDDAFFRHEEWKTFEPRSMMGRLPTERENQAKKIDEGEAYYRGTAGKYIEMDGDIALILNGGGASIANMDALIQLGLKPANYTEYSGNPPREKVRALTEVVLSKPGIRGLWMCGVVANFTNMKETFLGVIDVLDELKPTYPIVVRRDGPESAEAIRLVRECAARNHLNLKIFNKDVSMTESAHVLANMVR